MFRRRPNYLCERATEYQNKLMKPIRIFRRASCRILFAAALSAIVPARAQTTATDTNSLGFPGVEHLPGKPPAKVWDGLGRMWQTRRPQFKRHAADDKGAVVFLGDSITQGWGMLQSDFPDLKVANRGISGDISSGVLFRLKDDVLDLDPAGVVLLIGTNDLGDGEDPTDVAQNIEAILQAIESYNPRLKVIVCQVMPRSENGQQLYADKIKQLNSTVADYVKTNPNFALCDTWSIYADANGDPNPADFVPDHLHLNRAGYVAWKQALDPVISKMNFTTPKPAPPRAGG
jgi:lysophospholipase L1-like esterase